MLTLNADSRLLFDKSKKGHYWLNIKARVMSLVIDMCIVPRKQVYLVSFENVEQFWGKVKVLWRRRRRKGYQNILLFFIEDRQAKNLILIFVDYVFVVFHPFPHIDAFWHLCSRRLFENIVTKEEIARNEQFLLLPQCFPLLVIGYPFNSRDFPFFDKIYSKPSAAELLYEGKG